MLVILTKGTLYFTKYGGPTYRTYYRFRVTDSMLLEYFSPMGSVSNIKIVAVSEPFSA
jgi:hypothetical protein